jgi:hypothetical protein
MIRFACYPSYSEMDQSQYDPGRHVFHRILTLISMNMIRVESFSSMTSHVRNTGSPRCTSPSVQRKGASGFTGVAPHRMDQPLVNAQYNTIAQATAVRPELVADVNFVYKMRKLGLASSSRQVYAHIESRSSPEATVRLMRSFGGCSRVDAITTRFVSPSNKTWVTSDDLQTGLWTSDLTETSGLAFREHLLPHQDHPIAPR